MNTYDIVTVSDFRLPGGTNHSTAQELAVHRQLGLSTGLLHANSRLTSRPIPWSAPIVDELHAGSVTPLIPGTPSRATVALLRHPRAIEAMPDVSTSLRTEHALIIANQPAHRPSGTVEYDVPGLTEIVRRRLGVDPVWAPIGPIVRRTLGEYRDSVSILPDDWTNIFAQGGTPPARRGFKTDRPRIGRHSRAQVAKWPASPDEITAAYPDSARYDVRVLGGAKPAINILGHTPKHWTIHPFGAVSPVSFLAEIDFWVYFHHPNWSEGYGRAIMEALWSGAVVILPGYLRVTYGDAAVYGDPADVTTIIDEFRSGSRDYLEQSVRGQRFASAHSPEVHAQRIQALLDSHRPSSLDRGAHAWEQGAPLRQAIGTSRRPVVSRIEEPRRPRALFITSNGSGMGHLTRMLGLARSLAHDVEPVFFSMSQGVAAVATAGFSYEYVPFNSALGTSSARWRAYFRQRLLAALDHYGAELIVFDGTWPYRGLIDALDERAGVRRVWVRRGMWKTDVESPHVAHNKHFDVIIEPGEHAHEYDEGATSKVENAHVVGPMTMLSHEELLSREAARAELGLESGAETRYALVTLGAGNINDVASTQEIILENIRAADGWEAVLTKAPIAHSTAHTAERTISTFPLSRYTRAFDFAVSATGYNSFAEWMVGGLPAVWIPNMSTTTDDQAARARWAADRSYGVRADEGDRDSIAAAMSTILDRHQRDRFAENLGAIPRVNGTIEAAQIIMKMLASPPARQGAKR